MANQNNIDVIANRLLEVVENKLEPNGETLAEFVQLDKLITLDNGEVLRSLLNFQSHNQDLINTTLDAVGLQRFVGDTLQSALKITDAGTAKIQAGSANSITIDKIAVGDGNGNAITIDTSATALTNQVWEGNVSDPSQIDGHPYYLFFDAFIPATVGGFTVREVALFDSDGDMFAIGATSAVSKEDPNQTVGSRLALRVVIEVSQSEYAAYFKKRSETVSQVYGDWSSLSGSAEKGSIVQHSGQSWLLLEDVNDIATFEPTAENVVAGVWINVVDELKAVAIANGVTVDKVAFLQTGVSLTAEVLRDVENELTLIAWDTLTTPYVITSYTANDYAGYDVVTDQGVFEFVTKEIHHLRTGYGFPGLKTITFIEGWGADNSGVSDSYQQIIKAQSYCDNVRAGAGKFLHSAPIPIGSDKSFYGAGRNTTTFEQTTITTTEDSSGSGILINAGARRWEFGGFTLTVSSSTAEAGIRVDDTNGAAEGLIEDFLISRNYQNGILGAQAFWNNTIRHGRIESQNGITIAGTSGSSINNLWEDVYVNHSNLAANGRALLLTATKTQTFLNCNFGGTEYYDEDTSTQYGEIFVQTSSSNSGLRFINCNFEGGWCTDGSLMFYHLDRSYPVYSGCTFKAFTGNTGVGSYVFKFNTNSRALFESSGWGETAAPSFGWIYANGGKVTLIDSPEMLDEDYFLYTNSSPRIRDVAGTIDYTNDVRDVLEDASVSRGILDYGFNKTLQFSPDNAVTAVDILTLSTDSESTSSSSGLLAGFVEVALSARAATAGVRVNSYERFNFFYNNSGDFSGDSDLSAAISPTTVSCVMSLTESGGVVTLNLAPSGSDTLTNIEITVKYNLRRSLSSNSNIEIN